MKICINNVSPTDYFGSTMPQLTYTENNSISRNILINLIQFFNKDILNCNSYVRLQSDEQDAKQKSSKWIC